MLFAYPLFLFALAATVIPIIIHLFQLRRYKKVVFSDIRFLKQLIEQNQKQRNIKEWLILLARCLAIACLVLAFSKPFIPYSQKNLLKADKVVSIFIDNSFSMSQQNKEGQLLEVAKNKAKEIVSFYGDNDIFQILTNDFEGKHQRFIDKKDFLLYLEEIKLSNQSKTFDNILARQKQLFSSSFNANKISYFISDLQENQFKNTNQSDSSMLLNFVPIVPNQNANISIDSAWIDQPLILPNTPVILKVKVSNFGKNEITDVPLTFKIDGVQKGIANVSCNANSSSEVQIQFTLKDIAYHDAELSLLDNPVVFDDKLFLTLKAYGNQSVIAINPNKSIQNIYSIDENYNLTSFNANSIDYGSFSNASCIIINEINSFSSGLQNEIHKYLNNGGVVLIIPSSNLNEISSTNLFLQSINAPLYNLSPNMNLKVAKLNLFDDVFKNVFSKIPEIPNWPVVNKYYNLTLNSTTKGYNIASLTNDAPFIFKSKYGKGSIYLMSSPLITEWSNFNEHALFVPFMLRLPLVNKQSGSLYYNLDKPITYSFEKNTNNKIVYLNDKKLEMAFDVKNNESKNSIYISGLNVAGNFNLLDQNKKNAIAKVAFNLNRTESNLKTISDENLNIKNAAVIDASNLLKHQKDIQYNFNGIQLWRWFLLAAFAFILLEVLLLKLK